MPGELLSATRNNDPTKAKAAGVISSIDLFDTMEIYPGLSLSFLSSVSKRLTECMTGCLS